MPFIKRALTEEEIAAVDRTALGIEARRVPPKKWEWSVDLDRRLLCTQLVSNPGEMREGSYWYLLLVDGQPCLFEVDAFSSRTLHGKATLHASFARSGLSGLSVTTLEALASEAHAAVSHKGEALCFRKGI
jgi:hypothetical protein